MKGIVINIPVIVLAKPYRYICIVMISTALLFQPSIVSAQVTVDTQNELPIVKLTADYQEIRVGESVTIVLKAIYPEGYELIESLEFPEIEGLEPTEAYVEPEEDDEEGIVEKKTKTFRAENEGKFIIQPVTVEFLKPDGKSIEVKSNGLMIVVLAADAPEEGLRDIKTLRKLKLPINLLNLGIIILASIALILLLFFVAGMWPKRERRIILQLPVNLEELYIGKLRDLIIPDEFDSGAVMELYLRMSLILREYLAERWEITATEGTTSEVLFELKKVKFGKPVEDSYSDVARAFDMVKYAKGRPFRENIEAAREAAMDFILQMSGARR